MAGNKHSQKKGKGRSAKRANTDGFFSVHANQAKSSFSALWQRPLGNILTLAVISMALAMPACLYLLGKNVAGAAEDVASPSQVSAYLVEGMPDARVMVLKDQIETWPLVKEVEYISPQQGLADLSQYAGFDQALSLLSGYALPGVLVITPESDIKTDIQALAKEVGQQQDVTDVRLDEDWLARLNAIKTLAGIIVVTLTILMLGAVFLIVGNTLRFNVLANKEEIQTMKLIGATDGFILRPYLYTGMWFGVLGAVIAWFVTALVTIVMNSAVEDLAALYDSQFRLIGLSWDESLLLIITGSLLGCIAARISAQRHLKEIEPV
ncbi:TPA: permease-like cell division protein FtsX [Vibrio parahaemolyticus]|uniref:permease-like cell division protein FtsX n=1 Tax=Vibrio parahaemolyticus TaxID=670 RepID=UPI0004049B77|nr:permease-like cell division protein FtsX [Vibrio parahaemolyticus]EGR1751913.1 cell division protein FtsX [Vibrio parahaemolyticus]EME0905526.1 cell division protein FtsX [Vibrio parahaemolyticus]MBE5155295.1 cell division protein FtsX [Vibrio parahaemolyticus]MBE5164620.1 cell division protein FtsX [Vibrio parahaemolyticus]MDF4666851.1 permease-like cell division protein FtsX [Vibrio parahaemolyticus]